MLDLGFDELYTYNGTTAETTPSGMRVDGTTAPEGYLHVKILEASGAPLTSPILLNGKGKRLKPTQKPVYATWSIYKEVSWAGITW